MKTGFIQRREIVISLIFHGFIFILLLALFARAPKIFNQALPEASEVPIIQASMISAISPPPIPEVSREKPIEKPIEKAVEKTVLTPSELKPEIKIPPIKPKLIKPKLIKPKVIPPKIEKPVQKPPIKINKPVAKPVKSAKPAKSAKSVDQKINSKKALQDRAEKEKALADIKQQTAAAAAAESQRVLTLEQKYMGLIQASIRAAWINQFDPLANLQVTLVIQLDPKGNVESVDISQSSGNSAFDRQAMAAVQKASPLPIPDDASVAKDFSEITLPFSNQLS